MVNTLTKGQAKVGKIIGEIAASAGEIGTTELADEAVTVGKMADLVRGSIFSGQTGSNRPAALVAKTSAQVLIGDGTDVVSLPVTGSVAITSGAVTTLAKGAEHEGRACVGYYYQTGTAADTELVTINTRTYEFDTNASITGDVQVDINSDQSADFSCTALAAAINTDGTRSVDAVVMAGNSDTTAGVMLVAKAVGASNFSLSTDVTNGGTVSAAAMVDAAAAASPDILAGEYTVLAADVTLWALTGGNSVPIAGFVSTSQPTLAGISCRTSAGAIKSLATVVVTMLQLNTNFWALILDDAGAVMATGDLISFHLIQG